MIELGGRNLVVGGRTLRHIFEIEAHLFSTLPNPIDELRLLCGKSELLAKKKFVADWIRRCRLHWLGGMEELKVRFLSSPEGRVFSVWQAVRENGVSYDWVLSAVSGSIDAGRAPSDLWQEVARRIAIAGGADELSSLGGLRKKPPSDGTKIGLAGAISWLVSERGWRKDDILDMTMASLRQVRAREAELNEGIDKELIADSEEGLAGLKEMQSRIYRLAAKAVLEGKRVDGYDESEDRKAGVFFEAEFDSKKYYIRECKKCQATGKSATKVMMRKFQVQLAPPMGNVSRYEIVCQLCGNKGNRESANMANAATRWNAANNPDFKEDDE